MGKELVGYRLAGLKGEVGCFYDPILRVWIRGNEIIPVEAVQGKKLVGTLFAQWMRDGGIVPVYGDEKKKGEATPPPVSVEPPAKKKPGKAELKKLSRPQLLKLAAEEYDSESLKDYTKDNLIQLLLEA